MLVVTVILSVLFEKPLPLKKTGLSHESVYASWNPKLRDGGCTYFYPLSVWGWGMRIKNLRTVLGVHKRVILQKSNKPITKQEQNQKPNDKEKHPKL